MVPTSLRKLSARALKPEIRRSLAIAAGFALLGGILLGISYSVNPPFNLYAAASPLFLFGALFVVLSEGVMKDAFARAYRYVRTPVGAIIFVGYLLIHYLLYGFFLEKVLISVYGYEAINIPATAYLSATVIYPPTALNAFLSVISFPSLTLWLPPYFGVVLIPFGVFMGFLIGILVVANLEVVREISSCPLGHRVRAAFLLPVAGVVSGASCCLSLPIVLTVAIPAAGVLTYTEFASYFAFFVFPLVTAAALHVNLHYTRGLLRSVSTPVEGAETGAD